MTTNKKANDSSPDEQEDTRSQSSADDDEGSRTTNSDEGTDDEIEENDDDNSDDESPSVAETGLLSRFALLGDSPYALMASFAILLLAVFIRFHLLLAPKAETTTTSKPLTYEELYQGLGPIPSTLDTANDFVYTITETAQLNTTHHDFYKRNGFIILRGLIESDLLDQLSDQSNELLHQLDQQGKLSRTKTNGKQFHVVQQSVALRQNPTDIPNATQDVSAFLNISLFSKVPKVASALMYPISKNGKTKDQNLRLMRDIFLTKDDDPYVCGWHVDDYGFWPTRADSLGINAWIALDDMPLDTGGGFALAVGSHVAPWRKQAQYAIGATTMAPKEGYTSARDMFANRTGGGTCNLETTAPWLNRRMEETKVVHELQRGDIIFHDRWLFHRTVPMTKQMESSKVYRRYSLRYGPGSSVIPPGFGTELSVLFDESNGGRTADDICKKDGPWYPQAMPVVDAKELLLDLKSLHENKISSAEKKRTARLKEMQPYLKEIAKKQQQQQQQHTSPLDASSGPSNDDWCMQRITE